MNHDWLPHKRENMLAMVNSWLPLLAANKTAWNIPPEALGDLTSVIAEVGELYPKTKGGGRTPIAVAECNTAFTDLAACMRNIKARHFFNPPLSDADFVSLGLKPRDTIRTPIPAPAAQVEADLVFPGIHMIGLKKIRPVSGIEPDRRSNYGIKVYWGIMGEAPGNGRFRLSEPPASGHDLPNSQFTRRKKVIFDFDGESGNTIFICLRYENPTGTAGPFGPMLRAVVP